MKYKSLLLPLSLVISATAMAGGHREPYQAQTDLIDKTFTEQQAPTIRVATFNMAAARVSSLTEIAKAIKALNADVVAIQEVDVLTDRSGNVDQPKKLAELTGLNIEFGRAIDFDGGQYGLAIASKYPILKTEVTQLPSGNREQRIVFEAHIDVPGFNAPITVFNAHLDTKEDPTMRVGQVRELNDTAIDTRGIKILLGDMNDVPESVTYRELSRYWNNITDQNVDFRSWPAGNPEIQVDYVMTSKAQVWKIKEITVPQNNTQYADTNWPAVTDHLPIVVEMKMLEQ
ncbi:endonuclease/exonuclease/phosphatase family protein [Vibrio sp. 10N.222.54.F12]|jgi:endonuclease/exonuclease/phosphatase family metal-dependent hydrolase|uniref:Endonuclease n=1 Tax=Vibrio splendidus TaxID=29497 RepID=A0A2N7K7M0_VIBSP|nr:MULTISPECIES: endonuclease/exonuclease/phosphatase family protein [Vibrio]MBE8565697.1 endonuclease/exonuclease/phosphatase family protein [Vibrio sp. OPT20]MCC4859344.1 endonuclease/exonuclease/phosphatase family protein [Vibrio splendidus]MCQ8867193.1 endonuclease/exonuclease/phosphatase family protein [Vibrio splendidus]MDH5893748.1 endonuclease/exonuclease/phosphatase family protein [Vibrio splendidus]MDP2499768.1 endonuclease/exonuclease/phosphatase family protein [Vibrio splendidus]